MFSWKLLNLITQAASSWFNYVYDGQLPFLLWSWTPSLARRVFL